MPCYHPLGAYIYVESDSRKRLRFIPGYKAGDEQRHRLPIGAHSFTQVPCGKCIGCRLDYASNWADRLSLEALDYPSDKRWFVTLTYDDAHLPPLGKCGIHTLFPRDVTLFLKRLRSAYPSEDIRYFYSGEYGESDSKRPHYHLILFGHSFDDLKYYKANDLGDPLFTSEVLSSLWRCGYVVIGEFSWNTAAYTARYVLKKVKGSGAKDLYRDAGILPEFCRMSRRPGIGSRRFSLDSDSYQLPNGRMGSLPKSYLDKMKDVDPDAVDAIKAVRSCIGDMYASERSRSLGTSLSEWLLSEERRKILVSKTLKGGLHRVEI